MFTISNCGDSINCCDNVNIIFLGGGVGVGGGGENEGEACYYGTWCVHVRNRG